MGGSGGADGGGFGGGWTGEADQQGSSNYGGYDYGGYGTGPSPFGQPMGVITSGMGKGLPAAIGLPAYGGYTEASPPDISGGPLAGPGAGPDLATKATLLAMSLLPFPPFTATLATALAQYGSGGGFPDVGSAGPGGLGGPSGTTPEGYPTPTGISATRAMGPLATTAPYSAPNFAAMAQGLVSSKDQGGGYKRLGMEAMKDRGYLSNLYKLAQKLGGP